MPSPVHRPVKTRLSPKTLKGLAREHARIEARFTKGRPSPKNANSLRGESANPDERRAAPAANTFYRSASDAPRSVSREAARRDAGSNLARHSRKCAICNHPDREAIDADFVSWRSESIMTVEYLLPARSSIYRHAAATGLLECRRRNLRGVCERILERVAEAPPSATAALRALRIYAQMTEDGRCIEAPKESIVRHVYVHEAEPAAQHENSGQRTAEARANAVETEAKTTGQPAAQPDAKMTEQGIEGETGKGTPKEISGENTKEVAQEAAISEKFPAAAMPASATADEQPEAGASVTPSSARHAESAPEPVYIIPDWHRRRFVAADLVVDPSWTHDPPPCERKIGASAQNSGQGGANQHCHKDLSPTPEPKILIGTQNTSSERQTA